MLAIRRILCPVDFSEASQHALRHAFAMARWYGSEIVALHVRNPVFVPSPPVFFAEMPPALPAESDREPLEARLQEWLAPAREAGLRTDVLFEESNNPAGRILERASSLPADAIVMGTHGRSGFERLMLGSVAERVLRKASCPVMTVPPPAVSTGQLPFKRLLCPVDFSEPSLAALRYAFSIAQESDARIMILHVLEVPSDSQELARDLLKISELRRQWETTSRLRLQALIPEEVRNWCAPEPMLRYGKPYRQILTMSEAEHVDLIVMGVHGRDPLEMALFGSTTNHVVRTASCPVLTLRT